MAIFLEQVNGYTGIKTMGATHAQNNYCETLSRGIHLLRTTWAPENSTQCVGDHALGTMNLTYLRTRNWHKYKLCTLKFKYSLPDAAYNCSNAFFGIQLYLIGLGYSFTENTHLLHLLIRSGYIFFTLRYKVYFLLLYFLLRTHFYCTNYFMKIC